MSVMLLWFLALGGSSGTLGLPVISSSLISHVCIQPTVTTLHPFRLLLHCCLLLLQVYNGSAASAPANKSRSGSICYDFVKGVCTRGSECRYSHDLTLIARMARGSSGGDTDQGQQADVCFDFLR